MFSKILTTSMANINTQAGITRGTLNPKSGTCMTNISMHHASTMHMTREHLWKSPSRIFVEDISWFLIAAMKPLITSNSIKHMQAIIAHAIASVIPNKGKFKSITFSFQSLFCIRHSLAWIQKNLSQRQCSHYYLQAHMPSTDFLFRRTAISQGFHYIRLLYHQSRIARQPHFLLLLGISSFQPARSSGR